MPAAVVTSTKRKPGRRDCAASIRAQAVPAWQAEAEWQQARDAQQERSAVHRDVHQTVANGVDDQLGGLVNSERIHDIGAMNRHGVGAEVEVGRQSPCSTCLRRSVSGFRVRAREPGIAFALQGRWREKPADRARFRLPRLGGLPSQVQIHRRFSECIRARRHPAPAAPVCLRNACSASGSACFGKFLEDPPGGSQCRSCPEARSP